MSMRLLTKFLVIGLTGLFLVSCSDDSEKTVVENNTDASGQNAKMNRIVEKIVTTKSGFSNDQEKAIADIVRKTLLAKPEILQEAFSVLEKKEKAEQERRKLSALSDSADVLFRSKFSPVAGNPKGDVTVVEFFDYNCPYCRKAFKDLETVMGQDSKLRVVFKEYPIFGGVSQLAARAALAAKKQGKYFEFHKALLEVNSRVTEETVYRKAKLVGVDVIRMKKDMNDSDITDAINETKRLADSLGVRGTPAFFVGDKMIPGAPSDLVDIIKGHVADIRKNGCKSC